MTLVTILLFLERCVAVVSWLYLLITIMPCIDLLPPPRYVVTFHCKRAFFGLDTFRNIKTFDCRSI